MENEDLVQASLRAALEAVEAGDNPQEDSGGEAGSSWTIGVGGHGINNRTVRFTWRDARLSIDCNLPWARAFVSEKTRAEDANLVRAALRLAILLLKAHKGGKLFADGERSLSVTADGDGVAYRFNGPDGAVLDEADDWDALVARLRASVESVAGDSADIIWP